MHNNFKRKYKINRYRSSCSSRLCTHFWVEQFSNLVIIRLIKKSRDLTQLNNHVLVNQKGKKNSAIFTGL